MSILPNVDFIQSTFDKIDITYTLQYDLYKWRPRDSEYPDTPPFPGYKFFKKRLRPSVRGKITSENGNLRNLRYTKNICHMILALITSESAHPIIQVEQLKQRFWHNSEICLLFSRKQQQIFTTCC